jgi:hypothetical protein
MHLERAGAYRRHGNADLRLVRHGEQTSLRAAGNGDRHGALSSRRKQHRCSPDDDKVACGTSHGWRISPVKPTDPENLASAALDGVMGTAAANPLVGKVVKQVNLHPPAMSRLTCQGSS